MTASPSRKFERHGMPTAVLDATEAAAYLALTRDSVYRLVRAGDLPHTRVGSSIRFRVADLDRYLEERTSRTWTKVDGRGRPRRKASA